MPAWPTISAIACDVGPAAVRCRRRSRHSIGAIHEQGPEPDLPPGTPLADSFADASPKVPAFGFAMPGPRAAAVAVMAMLGFGVIAGSLVGGTSVVTLASAP